MIKIANKEEFFAAAKENRILIVDVYADWCGPCKMMSPILDNIAAELTDVAFIKIDADQESEFVAEYNIMSIPTLLFFKEEELIGKLTGFQTKVAVVEAIKRMVK